MPPHLFVASSVYMERLSHMLARVVDNYRRLSDSEEAFLELFTSMETYLEFTYSGIEARIAGHGTSAFEAYQSEFRKEFDLIKEENHEADEFLTYWRKHVPELDDFSIEEVLEFKKSMRAYQGYQGPKLSWTYHTTIYQDSKFVVDWVQGQSHGFVLMEWLANENTLKCRLSHNLYLYIRDKAVNRIFATLSNMGLLDTGTCIPLVGLSTSEAPQQCSFIQVLRAGIKLLRQGVPQIQHELSALLEDLIPKEFLASLSRLELDMDVKAWMQPIRVVVNYNNLNSKANRANINKLIQKYNVPKGDKKRKKRSGKKPRLNNINQPQEEEACPIPEPVPPYTAAEWLDYVRRVEAYKRAKNQ